MLESVTLSRSQFGRFYRSTVPPDIDYLYGYNSPLFHASVAKVRAEDTSSTFYKSQWIALASARTANRIIVQQKVADRLDNDVAEAVLAVNRSDIATFVDGLTASPPICEMAPLPPIPERPPWFFVPIVEPVPPEWRNGEVVSGYDALGVAAQWQVARDTEELGMLEQPFDAAIERFVGVGLSRI